MERFFIIFSITNAWEHKYIKEIFKITRGYVLATNAISDSNNSNNLYPVYSSQTYNDGLLGYYDRYLFDNAITWTTDGANAGTVNYRTGKFYCTNVCGVLLEKSIKPNEMLAEVLNRVARNYVSYVGNPKLMNNVVANILINYPNSEIERNKISTLLSSLNSLISLHQRKL